MTRKRVDRMVENRLAYNVDDFLVIEQNSNEYNIKNAIKDLFDLRLKYHQVSPSDFLDKAGIDYALKYCACYSAQRMGVKGYGHYKGFKDENLVFVLLSDLEETFEGLSILLILGLLNSGQVRYSECTYKDVFIVERFAGDYGNGDDMVPVRFFLPSFFRIREYELSIRFKNDERLLNSSKGFVEYCTIDRVKPPTNEYSKTSYMISAPYFEPSEMDEVPANPWCSNDDDDTIIQRAAGAIIAMILQYSDQSKPAFYLNHEGVIVNNQEASLFDTALSMVFDGKVKVCAHCGAIVIGNTSFCRNRGCAQRYNEQAKAEILRGKSVDEVFGSFSAIGRKTIEEWYRVEQVERAANNPQ